ncbi:hypothetical protein TNIN_131201 [Trichonephila inaurata madagascariensis]|uniref:Uncharacterized protein n=1 Tax=Trichonephila inaurata madagascariensis TaxID=2747483 RepID=A0A8X6JRI3_9ARAC|nr:hypothetical protein TNIN_131201 [Trichonephila inaurata madagascariensis]
MRHLLKLLTSLLEALENLDIRRFVRFSIQRTASSYEKYSYRIVETPHEKHSKALHSNDTDVKDNFEPFRLTPEITGFTEEDNENHRAYRREPYFGPCLDV